MLSILYAIFTASTVFAASIDRTSKRAGVAFFSPLAGGGSELDAATPTLGEPLNVIISGLSTPSVLTDSGFLAYSQSLGFSFECLNLHLGGPQTANLGDGNGNKNQTVEYRMDFGSPDAGTCLESLSGGNHLRMFRQDGPSANSGALFLAVSEEENIFKSHTISPNGYDKGRDALVKSAVAGSSMNGITYTATSQTITGLITPGSAGINHGIATDGNVILLTVTSSG